MTQRPEVAVIGGGIVGLSTAYALALRGASVAVYERGVPGNGQSGGEARVFRHAHDDPRLTAFVRDSRALWREWEERLGVELVSTDGAVAIGSSVESRLPVLERVEEIRARAIEGGELAELHPLLAPYSGPAMLDEDGGAIRARAAIAALTGALGDALVADDVISIRSTASGTVEVRTGGETAEYASLVVCAGRDTVELARAVGLSIPVRLAVHVRIAFEVAGEPPQHVACLQDSSGQFGEVGIYAAPYPGNRSYAVGLSETVDTDADDYPTQLAALGERARDYVSRALPGLDPEPVEYRHCWVTELPWGEDGVGVWQADRMLFVAGHNLFKQAPWLGRELAGAASGEPLAQDLLPEARLGEPPA